MKTPWEALLFLLVTAVVFGCLGATVGLMIGSTMPGYYQSIFGGEGRIVDPIAVGFGQGLTQGLVAGLVTGAFLLTLFHFQNAKKRP